MTESVVVELRVSLSDSFQSNVIVNVGGVGVWAGLGSLRSVLS